MPTLLAEALRKPGQEKVISFSDDIAQPATMGSKDAHTASGGYACPSNGADSSTENTCRMSSSDTLKHHSSLCASVWDQQSRRQVICFQDLQPGWSPICLTARDRMFTGSADLTMCAKDTCVGRRHAANEPVRAASFLDENVQPCNLGRSASSVK